MIRATEGGEAELGLGESFDAVIMLTWSDWDTEPRSNRYHYATRFARHVPVLFVQHGGAPAEGLQVRRTEVHNLDVVNLSQAPSDEDFAQFRRLLALRGICSPLLWVYDPITYRKFISEFPGAFLAYHATEDYFEETGNWSSGIELVRKSLRTLLERVDVLVACSERVATSYLELGGYRGPLHVAENGCDADFFFDAAAEFKSSEGRVASKVALFQGGINQRLDYDLLKRLVDRLPDWEFRFVGRKIDSAGWQDVLERPNATYLGELEPRELAKEMIAATVGIIPFKQDQWIRNSLPLKAYEYVACGLPVVSVPVEALEAKPDLFWIAHDACEFATAIEAAANTRLDESFLMRRRAAASARSYEVRFREVATRLLALTGPASEVRASRLEVAVLYDAGSTHVGTVREHLESFQDHGRFRYVYIPASTADWSQIGMQPDVDLTVFDAVLVHFSVRLAFPGHLSHRLLTALCRYRGIKIAFVQDEYDNVEDLRRQMERIGFDLFYTCVPMESVETVYPSYRFPQTRFRHTLTGYVSHDARAESYARPLKQRPVMIAYRGRKLPPIYGELGAEKYEIGLKVKEAAINRGLAVDIEVEDRHRIYGDDWYRFLGSARATLGTESGSNVFAFTSDLAKSLKQIEQRLDLAPEERDSEIRRALWPFEGRVQMNQISPKIFEAIRTKTALVLYEGTYSSVVRPNEHFIPLRKDLSNIDEVFDKLRDDEFVERITARAYNDIVSSQRYSYRRFTHEFEQDVAQLLRRKPRRASLSLSLYGEPRAGHLEVKFPILPMRVVERADLGKLGAAYLSVLKRHFSHVRSQLFVATALRPLKWSLLRLGRPVFLKLPQSYQSRLRQLREQGIGIPRPLAFIHVRLRNLLLKVWKRIPASVREKLRPLVVRLLG